MQIQSTYLSFSRDTPDPQRMQEINQTLFDYSSQGWELVSTNVIRHADAVDFWLFLQKA